eukprot:SAG31_NODE_24981_length_470_cov_1.110512_2_plen_54_part_01
MKSQRSSTLPLRLDVHRSYGRRGFPGYLGGANGSAGIPLAPSNAKATANYMADW